MGMGGDLAAQWLEDFSDMRRHDTEPFVLVVEGAVQDKTHGGAWNDDQRRAACRGARSACRRRRRTARARHARDVVATSHKANCVAIIPIGQCATLRRLSRLQAADQRHAPTGWRLQPDAVADRRHGHLRLPARARRTAGARRQGHQRSGLPDQPVVVRPDGRRWLVDLSTRPLVRSATCSDPARLAGIDLDRRRLRPPPQGRLPDSDPQPVLPALPRLRQGRVRRASPAIPAACRSIGCKGPSTNSLCGTHGWNSQQPQNSRDVSRQASPLSLQRQQAGGHCTPAGHPCMACTEKGYPDASSRSWSAREGKEGKTRWLYDLTGTRQRSRSRPDLTYRGSPRRQGRRRRGGNITEADAHGNLWRGFENFLLGRDANDAITFTQRICGVARFRTA